MKKLIALITMSFLITNCGPKAEDVFDNTNGGSTGGAADAVFSNNEKIVGGCFLPEVAQCHEYLGEDHREAKFALEKGCGDAGGQWDDRGCEIKSDMVGRCSEEGDEDATNINFFHYLNPDLIGVPTGVLSEALEEACLDGEGEWTEGVVPQ